MRFVFFAVACVAIVLATGPAAAQVTIYTGPQVGTYGNDTASTLYLRPLNNAMLGNSYFGSGYPHSNTSVTVLQAPQGSGIQRANEYLAATGWTAWQREKQALLTENAALRTRLQVMEQRLAELEARLRQVEHAR